MAPQSAMEKNGIQDRQINHVMRKWDGKVAGLQISRTLW
jgi:hypothetical protein